MSMHPHPVPPIPEETVRVAHAAFSKGNLYLTLRDKLGTLYQDDDFSTLYPQRGQPAHSPWRLALITILQFVENLSDRQAAEAVRARIDWKYLLSLPLSDSGFDFSVLSEFRTRLVEQKQAEQLLNRLLQQAQAQGLLKANGKQRTDSTHVLAAIRMMNRYERVGETLRHALNVLATVAPEWLLGIVDADWFERYSERIESFRLPKLKERDSWLLKVGLDGHHLLAQIDQAGSPLWLRQIPAIETLRRVWIQQFYLEGEQLSIRSTEDMPMNDGLIESPYDIEARSRTKRTTYWTGYTVSLTETCDQEAPNLIIDVETVPATKMDVDLTQTIHEKLAQRELLPKEHFMDTGYISAEDLVNAKENYNVEIVGPVLPDTSWQAQANRGFDLMHFTIDWQQQQVCCPQGNWTRSWSEQPNRHGQTVINVHFSRKDCDACPVRSDCTQARSGHGRSLNFLPQAQHLMLQKVRQAQTTKEFQQRYATRAGVEGCLSQGVRAFGLRRSRYSGLAKTHLQHVMTAVAMNLARLWNWWQEMPKAQTRVSRFRALAPTL